MEQYLNLGELLEITQTSYSVSLFRADRLLILYKPLLLLTHKIKGLFPREIT